MTVILVSAAAPFSAPADVLWDLISDTDRYAEWVVGTTAVSRPAGAAQLGTTYEEINPILGPWRARTRWTVTDFDPPHRQVHRSQDIPIASEFLVIMEVAPQEQDGGCEVTVTLRATSSLGPLGACACRILKARTRRDNERTLANLARLVEASD